ncbi:MAG: hypothetical protein AB8I08_22030 [Sandaracinaceae bacterium]
MDRDRLNDWLRATPRAWRWRYDEDYDRYEAVEVKDGALHFFAHSHVPGEDGIYREATQSFDAFLRDGPLWRMPEPEHRALWKHVAGLVRAGG